MIVLSQSVNKLCYKDTDSLIIHIETEDIYEYIANDVEKTFDTPNYKVNRPLPIEKNRKSNWINKR